MLKRVLAILLCIVMMLSMVACGGNQGNNGGNIAKPKGDPSEEDLAAIGYYEKAINALDEYAETGRLAFCHADYGMEAAEEYVKGQKALAAYYDLLTNLEEIDKWVGTEHITNTGINWDRQAVLDSFTIVEDVLVDGIYKKTLPDEDPYESSLAGMIQYREDGTVLKFGDNIYKENIWEVTYNPSVYTSCSYWIPEYDGERMLTQLTGFNTDYAAGEAQEQVSDTRSFTYDASGKLIQENLKNKHWDIDYQYSYDEAGRLSQISWYQRTINMTIDYTYDEAGKLIQTVETTPYTDSDGNISSARKTVNQFIYEDGEQPTAKTVNVVYLEKGEGSTKESPYPGWAIRSERTDNCSYTYDEQGRLQKKTVTYGDIHYYLGEQAGEVSSYSVTAEEYEYVFGDYYIYSPAN